MQPDKLNSLFLAWRDPKTRAWFPIGLLQANITEKYYVFQYTQGAMRAQNEVDFTPLISFPDLSKKYKASELFPLFKNRVLGSSRKNFSDYLESLDIKEECSNPIEILAVSGGEKQTDTLEVFPKIEKKSDNSFACRFFLHGLRHTNVHSLSRSSSLSPNEELRVSLELNNPATGLAIQLSTEDYQFIGWAPRYLISDVLASLPEVTKLKAKVVRVNEDNVPPNMRILIELTGMFPSNVTPMSAPDFQIV